MDEIGGTGPPPIRQGEGRLHLEVQEPFRLVSLDAAAFDWLWRVVEQRYREHSNRAPASLNGDIHGLQTEVTKRTVIAFREAAGTLGPPPVPSQPRKRFVRTPNQG